MYTFYSRKEYQPLPFRNVDELNQYYVPAKDHARAIFLRNLPQFAIGEDIKLLLGEYGFTTDLVLIRYRGTNGHNSSSFATVIFSTAEQAQRALEEVQDAPLFDKKIMALPYSPPLKKTSRVLAFEWGWYATKRPDLKYLRLRAPVLSPPTNVCYIICVTTVGTISRSPDPRFLYL